MIPVQHITGGHGCLKLTSLRKRNFQSSCNLKYRYTYCFYIITARKRSGKVMFSVMCVCSQGAHHTGSCPLCNCPSPLLCTGLCPQACSNLLRLDHTVHETPPPPTCSNLFPLDITVQWPLLSHVQTCSLHSLHSRKGRRLTFDWLIVVISTWCNMKPLEVLNEPLTMMVYLAENRSAKCAKWFVYATSDFPIK